MTYRSVHPMSAPELLALKQFAEECPAFGFTLCGSKSSTDLWKSSWNADAPAPDGLSEYVRDWADSEANFALLTDFSYTKDQRRFPIGSEFVSAWRKPVDCLLETLSSMIGEKFVYDIFPMTSKVNQHKPKVIGLLRLLAWTHHIQCSKVVSNADITEAVRTRQVQATDKQGQLKWKKKLVAGAKVPIMKTLKSYPTDPRVLSVQLHCKGGKYAGGDQKKHTVTIPDELKGQYTTPAQILVAKMTDEEELDELIALAQARKRELAITENVAPDAEFSVHLVPDPDSTPVPEDESEDEEDIEVSDDEDEVAPELPSAGAMVVREVLTETISGAMEQRVREFHGFEFYWDAPKKLWRSALAPKRGWGVETLEKETPNKALGRYLDMLARKTEEAN